MHLTAFSLLVLMAITTPQDGVPPPQPPVVHATRPDTEAFRRAEALADPAEKLAAMRRFPKQFPNSNQLTDSELAVFELLVEHWPHRHDEIRAAIQRMLSRVPSRYPVDRGRHSANEFESRLRTVRWIVEPLLEKRLLLGDAQRLVHATWPELDRFHRAMRAELLDMLADLYEAQGNGSQAAEARREVAAARRAGSLELPGTRLVPPPQPPLVGPPKPRFPEHENRYQQALTLKDLSARLDGLLALQGEFLQPTATTARRAEEELLELLLEKRPVPSQQLDPLLRRMRDTGNPYGEREPALEQMVEGVKRVVRPLIFRRTLLVWARGVMDESLADMEVRSRHMRGDVLQLEGRVALARGDRKAAEAAFRNVLALNPTLDTGAGRGSDPAVHLELARILQSRGQEAAALEHLLSAAVMRRPSRAELHSLSRVYAKIHGTSVSLETALDGGYARLFPNPVPRPAGLVESRSGRVVLFEMFSGAVCQPCQASDLAHERLLQRYPAAEVAAVSYHVDVPGPDPMTTAATEARHQGYDLAGVPSSRVDGRHRLPPLAIAGGPRAAAPAAYRSYSEAIDGALDTPPQAHIAVNASQDEGRIVVNARVSKVSPAAPRPRLIFLLVQKTVRYQGENSVRFHPMVVRAVGGARDQLYEISGAEGAFTHIFDIGQIERELRASFEQAVQERRKDDPEGLRIALEQASDALQVDTADLAVVAFVQQGDGAVLQAAQSDVPVHRSPVAKQVR